MAEEDGGTKEIGDHGWCMRGNTARMLHLTLYTLSCVTIGLGFWVVKHRRAHTICASLWTWALAVDVAMLALRPLAIQFFWGWLAYTALTVSWPAAVAVAACSVLWRSRRGAAAVALSYITGTLAIAVIACRGCGLARMELVEDGFLVLQIVFVAFGIASVYAHLAARRGYSLSAGAVTWAVIVETCQVVGPYWWGCFAHWDMARWLYLAFYAVLIGAQGEWIWTHRPGSKFSRSFG